VIEPMVAEFAARRRDPKSLATLAAVVESAAPGGAMQEGAADLAAAQAAEFFRALAAVAGNRVLSMSHEPLLQLMASSLHKLVARRILEAGAAREPRPRLREQVLQKIAELTGGS